MTDEMLRVIKDCKRKPIAKAYSNIGSIIGLEMGHELYCKDDRGVLGKRYECHILIWMCDWKLSVAGMHLCNSGSDRVMIQESLGVFLQKQFLQLKKYKGNMFDLKFSEQVNLRAHCLYSDYGDDSMFTLFNKMNALSFERNGEIRMEGLDLEWVA